MLVGDAVENNVGTSVERGEVGGAVADLTVAVALFVRRGHDAIAAISALAVAIEGTVGAVRAVRARATGRQMTRVGAAIATFALLFDAIAAALSNAGAGGVAVAVGAVRGALVAGFAFFNDAVATLRLLANAGDPMTIDAAGINPLPVRAAVDGLGRGQRLFAFFAAFFDAIATNPAGSADAFA